MLTTLGPNSWNKFYKTLKTQSYSGDIYIYINIYIYVSNKCNYWVNQTVFRKNDSMLITNTTGIQTTLLE